MAEIRIAESLALVDARAWNACFPDALEDYDYLRATESAGIAGFRWRYVMAVEGDQILAAIPAFLTDYPLDTTLEGPAKKITGAVRSLFPHALTLKLACLGSPVNEFAFAGFHPSVDEAAQPVLLETMVTAFEQHAVDAGHRLIGMKDVPAFQQSIWQRATAARNYLGIPGLPVAELAIGFMTMEEYFAQLSAATRKDMRRKLKARAQLRTETRRDISDVLPQIMALYQSTRARADMQLEELTPGYFTNLLTLGDRARCVLYFHDDELLAANFLLQDTTTLLDKFFLMDARGRDYNLYFVSWFTNIEYCLAHGITRYQSGQAGYDNKVRLGSDLVRTTMYFKHRNRLMQGALRMAAPFLAADDFTKEAA